MSGGLPLPSFVFVQVPGLVKLPVGANYGLIGSPQNPHPDGHWGTPAAIIGLMEIADDYKNTFYGQNPIPQNDKLRYNDLSLVWGGKFDLNHKWGSGDKHGEHRRGINCDVRCCNGDGAVPLNRRTQLEQIFRQRGSTLTGDETQTQQPHWHLRFLFGAQNVAVNRTSGHFVAQSFSSALEREADPDEWQERMDTVEAAHAQGQVQTIDAAKALTAALFHSVEYANRHRSDPDFVSDLYATFLLREPDSDGLAFWLSVLQNDNSNGLDGRANLIQAFVESSEFRNLIIGLSDTPAAGPVCNPVDEQSCYSQGGIWDPNSCSCIIDPGPDPPDPCLLRPWLCDQYPM